MKKQIISLYDIEQFELHKALRDIHHFRNINYELPLKNVMDELENNQIQFFNNSFNVDWSLKNNILKNLKLILPYLRDNEIEMIKKLLTSSKNLTPQSPIEILGIKILLQSYICQKDGEFSFFIDDDIKSEIANVFNTTFFKLNHNKFLEFDKHINALLYILGFIPMQNIVETFEDLLSPFTPSESTLYQYFLNYYRVKIFGEENPVLIHQGWNENINLEKEIYKRRNFEIEFSSTFSQNMSENILPCEKIYVDQFKRNFSSNLDEDCNIEKFSLAVRLLIKQNETLQDILNFTKKFTLFPLMKNQEQSLINLYNHTPKWIVMNSKTIN